MPNTLISLRVSDKLVKDTEELVKQEGFNSLQEFVRESWREKLEKHKLEKSLIELRKLYGSGKGKARIATKKQLDELARKTYFKSKY